jgi:hypothetical protein
MICHWELKTLEFQEQGKPIHIQGVKTEQHYLDALSPEQFVKWYKGNDTWALVVIQQDIWALVIIQRDTISHLTSIG